MRIKTFLFLVMFGLTGAHVKATHKGDSSRNQYNWLNSDLNYIQFYNRVGFDSFYDKWKNNKPITIVHFGDSHVQPDIFTGELRKILQLEKGMGGKGMIFPYSIAQTYSTLDYASYHTGNWRSSKSNEYAPRLPLGISGVTAKTSDPSASFTIRFHNPMPSHYTKLKLFCRQVRESYDVTITSAGKSVPVIIDDPGENVPIPFIEINLPEIGNTIKIQVVRKNNYEDDFEFYGMSLESATREGLVLHCLGVGGSQFRSLLAEALFEEQLSAVVPDLAVLDFGTNDHLYNNSIPPDMEARIVEVIKRVRNAAPACAILLTSTQDMNRRGMNITSGRDYSALIRKIAKDQNCTYYDWYWVSGGPHRMITWLQNGLAQADNIHLTISGYQLKGNLLGSAFKSTLNKMSGTLESLAFNPDTLSYDQMLARQDSIMKITKSTSAVAVNRPPVNILYHKIVRGETIGEIAEKYHVSAASIRAVNGIRGSKIIAGKTLRIEQPKVYAQVVTSNSKPPKVKHSTEDKKINQAFEQIANTKLVQHKIKSGETLSEIAEKYRVSVKDLKRVNGLKSSKIIAGKTLMIEVPLEEVQKNKT
jgi:LysM repeat protein